MIIDTSLVKSFISSNLPSVKKTQQVAALLDFPLDKLKKAFYKIERISLSRFIRESRVCRMKELLLSSETPCKVICLDLGVREDVGARLFKNSTGMTMEEFRRSYYGASPSNWQPAPAVHEDNAASFKLVITEKEIRKALSKTDEKDSHLPVPNRSGAWIQGPAH